RMGVYAPAPDVDAVRRAAVDVLGIAADGAFADGVGAGLHATLDEFG
ncbi:MAG: HD domain-containing protein, partial [Salinigranum sp.]